MIRTRGWKTGGRREAWKGVGATMAAASASAMVITAFFALPRISASTALDVGTMTS